MSGLQRSFAFSVVDKASSVVMSIMTMAIISRLLAPDQVGLFMIGSSIVILIEACRDFGVAACLVQARDLTPRLVSTAITITAILSAILGGALWFSAGPVAQFYGSPDLAPIMHVATLAFLAAPVANPMLALLRREMEFGKIALIGMAAGLTNACVSVGLAMMDFGALGLMWASVAAAMVTALGAVFAQSSRMPFRPSLAEWRMVVPFGAWSSVITLLGMLLDSLPRLFLGRMLGLDAAGIFGRAVSLNQLPERLFLSAVQPVVLPMMAARFRRNEDVSGPYLLGISYITALQWPVLVMIAILASPIVDVLLGDLWSGVAPLLRIVALSSLCLFPQYFAFPILVAARRLHEMAIASLLTVPVCAAIIYFAAGISLEAVAVGLFFTGALQAVAMLVLTRRCVHFSLTQLADTLGRSAIVTVSTAAPALLVTVGAGHTLGVGPALGLVALVAGAAGWAIGLRLARHPVETVLTGMLAQLRRRRAPRTS